MIPENLQPDASLPPEAGLALKPIHKRALGVAVGLTAGLLLAGVTAFHVVLRPQNGLLWLLSQYFYGYEESWRGVCVGFLWATVTGFVGGWFLAFAHNVLLAIMVLVIRTKAEMRHTRDFLDHI